MWFPDLPHVQARGDGGRRSRTQIIVIHATDNTASDENEAAYASRRADLTSAHFFNDGDSVIQALNTDEIAYGCLPHGNAISVQFELCGHSDALTDATMRQIAPMVKRVADLYGIPVQKIGPTEVRNGVKGICGHADITYAFPEDGGTHTDPGLHFPWNTFLSYIGDSAMPEFANAHLTEIQVSNAEHYLQALVFMYDAVIGGISDTVNVSQPSAPFVKTFKQLVSDVAELKSRPAVDTNALAKAIVDEFMTRK